MENKALVRRWFDEVWNKGREAAIGEMLAPHGVVHGVGPDILGPRGSDNGLLVEGWNVFDQLGMLQQLGVVNLPE